MDSKPVQPVNNFMQFNSKPLVTCVIAGGRRRVNFTFADKSELVEEFDMKTHECIIRKWRKAQDVRESQWVYEIGQPPQTAEQEQLVAASVNPIFVRKDTQYHFQFRVRNLSYPEDCYIVEVDDSKQEVVIKTTVKKYYKRFAIPDLRRMNLNLDKDKLKWVYKNNTLLISYEKPAQVLKREEDMRNEFERLNKKNPREGELECQQQ